MSKTPIQPANSSQKTGMYSEGFDAKKYAEDSFKEFIKKNPERKFPDYEKKDLTNKLINLFKTFSNKDDKDDIYKTAQDFLENTTKQATPATPAKRTVSEKRSLSGKVAEPAHSSPHPKPRSVSTSNLLTTPRQTSQRNSVGFGTSTPRNTFSPQTPKISYSQRRASFTLPPFSGGKGSSNNASNLLRSRSVGNNTSLRRTPKSPQEIKQSRTNKFKTLVEKAHELYTTKYSFGNRNSHEKDWNEFSKTVNDSFKEVSASKKTYDEYDHNNRRFTALLFFAMEAVKEEAKPIAAGTRVRKEVKKLFEFGKEFTSNARPARGAKPNQNLKIIFKEEIKNYLESLANDPADGKQDSSSNDSQQPPNQQNIQIVEDIKALLFRNKPPATNSHYRTVSSNSKSRTNLPSNKQAAEETPEQKKDRLNKEIVKIINIQYQLLNPVQQGADSPEKNLIFNSRGSSGIPRPVSNRNQFQNSSLDRISPGGFARKNHGNDEDLLNNFTRSPHSKNVSSSPASSDSSIDSQLLNTNNLNSGDEDNANILNSKSDEVSYDGIYPEISEVNSNSMSNPANSKFSHRRPIFSRVSSGSNSFDSTISSPGAQDAQNTIPKEKVDKAKQILGLLFKANSRSPTNSNQKELQEAAQEENAILQPPPEPDEIIKLFNEELEIAKPNIEKAKKSELILKEFYIEGTATTNPSEILKTKEDWTKTWGEDFNFWYNDNKIVRALTKLKDGYEFKKVKDSSLQNSSDAQNNSLENNNPKTLTNGDMAVIYKLALGSKRYKELLKTTLNQNWKNLYGEERFDVSKIEIKEDDLEKLNNFKKFIKERFEIGSESQKIKEEYFEFEGVSGVAGVIKSLKNINLVADDEQNKTKEDRKDKILVLEEVAPNPTSSDPSSVVQPKSYQLLRKQTQNLNNFRS